MVAKLAENISSWLITKNCKIYSGFGKNLGGYVVKGAFEGCQLQASGKNYNEQVFLCPFPYLTDMEDAQRKMLEFRKKMLLRPRILLVFCGQKYKDDSSKELINSQGVMEEYEIAKQQGCIIIPVSATGGSAKQIWNDMHKENVNQNKDETNNKQRQETGSHYFALNLALNDQNYDKIFQAIQALVNYYIN